jgi:MYXO-CTERM domain-containing protein
VIPDTGVADTQTPVDAPAPDAALADGPVVADGAASTPTPSEGCDCSLTAPDGWSALPMALILLVLLTLRRRSTGVG